uniref:Major facilitator superfamily (MFS) profile domain-containing protein n=1 Tax=Biomphalaria glabrata TaxID=6526 RepID=A0A2C9K193_BIOGL
MRSAEVATRQEEITHWATPLWNSSRFTLAILAFLAFFNFYSLRINMSMTIVCMVNHTAILPQDTETYRNITSVKNTDCAELDLNHSRSANGSESKQEDGEFVWDKESQGLIHGSLFWGYIVTNLAGGILATRYGGKHVIGLSLLLAAILTILVPVVSRASITGLMVLRFLTGAAQGFVSPAMQSLWTHWAPPLESSRLRSFCFAGSQVAKVITYPISGLLCEYGFDGGWPSVFYLQGLIGILWYIAWTFLVFDSPAQHPRISAEERVYIETSLEGIVTTNHKKQPPWHSIWTSVPVWAIIVAHTCSNWGEYTFLTNMPTYIKEVLHFDIKKNGFLSSVPYLAVWVVITSSSWLADLVRSKKWLSTTGTRKLFNSIGKL